MRISLRTILMMTTLTCALPSSFYAASLPSSSPSTSNAPIAIVGAKLLTISHGTIDNGVLVLRDGKISAVGTRRDVQVPKGASIVDGAGMTVYPGLIDAETNLGIEEVGSDKMNDDRLEQSDEIMPHMHVYDAFHAESAFIPVDRFNGITNAVVAPGNGDLISGQDIFIQLYGENRDAMILERDAALAMNYGAEQRRGGRNGPSKFPSTRMGLISDLRQNLLDAQQYAAKKAAASKDFKVDLKMEALLPYMQGKRPVVIGVDEGYDIETIMKVAQEFHLKVILSHVTQSQEILDEVASYHVPVIVGPIWALPDANQRYDAVYTLPAELQKRGVKIAFASYGNEFARNLPYAAGTAVGYGLSYDSALKAITLNTAEMFGMADTLGSLDAGKTANVVMANGDPLDVRTDIKQVWIDGKAIPMVTRQTILRDAYAAK